MSFEEATATLYDWYKGQTGHDGEMYGSEWREDKEKERWFNPHFPECEIRRIYFYSPNTKAEVLRIQVCVRAPNLPLIRMGNLMIFEVDDLTNWFLRQNPQKEQHKRKLACAEAGSPEIKQIV
jgi:hypothetical protein